MRENRFRPDLRRDSVLTHPGTSHQDSGIRLRGPGNEMRAKVLLKGPAGGGCSGRVLTNRLVRDVPNGH